MERRTSGEPFDAPAFTAWLDRDPRRAKVFEAMWRRVTGPDMDAAVRAYDRRGSARRTTVASGVAVLLIGAVAYKAMPVIELSFASPQAYAAEEGSVRKVRLQDGTRLTLAGGATIAVRYTRHDRTVELTRGALYADVAHDARRPFRINTPNARIVDIGTSFEVLSKPGDTRVRVTSGTVDFGRNGWFNRSIRLKEKQAAILDGASLRRVADIDPAEVARWRNEWIEYRGAPLRQVVADLEALSRHRIEIADEALAKKPVSGRIRLSDPVSQLENLAITHDFQIRQTHDALILNIK